MDPERTWSLDSLVAETRADVRHVQSDVVELRNDVRRLDDRMFQLLVLELGTLAAVVGTLVAQLVR